MKLIGNFVYSRAGSSVQRHSPKPTRYPSPEQKRQMKEVSKRRHAAHTLAVACHDYSVVVAKELTRLASNINLLGSAPGKLNHGAVRVCGLAAYSQQGGANQSKRAADMHACIATLPLMVPEPMRSPGRTLHPLTV